MESTIQNFSELAKKKKIQTGIKQVDFSSLPEYVWAEVFLENSGFFTPSSNRIKYIYTKTKTIIHKNNTTCPT